MAAKNTPLLTLFTGRLEPGRYNWSPFVNKLDTRLRLSGISYDLKAGSLSEAPKGKIPYVKLSEAKAPSGSTMIGDTTFVTQHLVESGLMEDLNKQLSAVDRAYDLALRSMLEDKIYFYNGIERWLNPTNFYLMRDVGPLAPIPYPLRLLVGNLAYWKNQRTLHGQGASRYTPSELSTLRDEAWTALNDVVGASQAKLSRAKRNKGQIAWALGGEHSTELDATLFGFLAAVLICPANPQAQATVRRLPSLLRYASEIHDEYFPDYEKWET